MEVDLLLVGGGGAGGHNVGGGGGGGGIFYGKNIILEAGNYKIVVGRGGIGQTGLTTVRLATANGEPTYLCYDGKYETLVKFNLGGVQQSAIGLGGGSGATNVAGNLESYRGHNGGSGGGSSEGPINAHLANNGGLTTQPATFWNGTAYVIGGTNGRANTDTTVEFRGGGGGGGTVSSVTNTSSYTCGKDATQLTFITGGSVYSLSAGGGSAVYANTDLTATEALGGKGVAGSVFGGYGAFYNTATSGLAQATNGVDNSGSGGGGSGVTGGGGGFWTKTGNGGTGIAMIRYRLAERKNSSSLDLFRNNSTLTGYSVGNYEGQFKIQKQNQTTPAILVNPIQNVSIGSRSYHDRINIGRREAYPRTA
jgi:hypothetical protein